MKKALAEAETATRIDPESVENHMLLAGLYSSFGENQKGITEYLEALKLDPKNQEALLYLGALYLQIEDCPRATEELEGCSKLDPNSVWATTTSVGCVPRVSYIWPLSRATAKRWSSIQNLKRYSWTSRWFMSCKARPKTQFKATRGSPGQCAKCLGAPSAGRVLCRPKQAR